MRKGRIIDWQMAGPRTLLISREEENGSKVIIYEWDETPSTDAVLSVLSIGA